MVHNGESRRCGRGGRERDKGGSRIGEGSTPSFQCTAINKNLVPSHSTPIQNNHLRSSLYVSPPHTRPHPPFFFFRAGRVQDREKTEMQEMMKLQCRCDVDMMDIDGQVWLVSSGGGCVRHKYLFHVHKSTNKQRQLDVTQVRVASREKTDGKCSTPGKQLRDGLDNLVHVCIVVAQDDSGGRKRFAC